VLGSESSTLFSLSGAKVPGNESSREQKLPGTVSLKHAVTRRDAVTLNDPAGDALSGPIVCCMAAWHAGTLCLQMPGQLSILSN